eukprot:gene11119-11273_t
MPVHRNAQDKVQEQAAAAHQHEQQLQQPACLAVPAIAAAEDADCVLLGTLHNGLSQTSLDLMAAAAAAAGEEQANFGADTPTAAAAHLQLPVLPTAGPHLAAAPAAPAAGIMECSHPSFQVLQYSLDEDWFEELADGGHHENNQAMGDDGTPGKEW